MELHGTGKTELRPFDIEGPYDKCKDFQLVGRDREYYMLLLDQMAKIAAAFKLGKIPWRYGEPAQEPWAYGLSLDPNKPQGPTGENPKNCMTKLETAIKFMSDTAKSLYPSYTSSLPFQKKFKDVMMKLNAYTNEISFWKNHDRDYVGLG